MNFRPSKINRLPTPDSRLPTPDSLSTPGSRLSTLEAFLDHLRVERRLSDHTIESYARDLTALARYAAGIGRSLDVLDRHALEAFVRQQRASGLSPRSVARSIAAIRSFYRFLVLDRRLEQSPADDVTPPRAWPS